MELMSDGPGSAQHLRGVDGSQPLSSLTIRPPLAAASRRSRTSLGAHPTAMKKILWFALVLAAPLAGAVAVARAEVVASVFSGVALTENNDLHLKQSGGTDLMFHDVSYEGKDFQSPPYYGARLTYFASFASEDSHWGFGLEFFHMKLYLNADDQVHVTGIRAGAPVDGHERVGDTVNSFSISHGLNFLTADAMYRWFLGQRGKDFAGRFQPYVGGGIGAVIPHVESNIGGVPFEQYQWHGPGLQGFVGMNFDPTRHWSVFVEYKLSYVDLDNLAIPGRSIGITPLTHHLVTGLSFRF